MIVITLLSSVHPVMKSNLAAPYATLMNIMACTVFRDIKLGRFPPDDSWGANMTECENYGPDDYITFQSGSSHSSLMWSS